MIKKLKGTKDILPNEVKSWQRLEDISRKIFKAYGYGEIRTPIIEETALFTRSVGKQTDIVTKQMYAFKDQGDRDIALRPEETASVVRAYLENRLDKRDGFIKLFYVGPMFRSERPQKGRLRQFNQIGVEAIGSYSPYLDAEVMILLDKLLKSYGLKNPLFKINSLGCKDDKESLKGTLNKELKPSLSKLCTDCNTRYEKNILRVLDCKVPTCKSIIQSISLENKLCTQCNDEFTTIQGLLKKAGVNFQSSAILVRGLDYYERVVFEVTVEGLGAQDSVAAGGRYDNLVSELGGEATGACGFAIGVERVLESLSTVDNKIVQKERESVFIATIGRDAYNLGFDILLKLRDNNIESNIDYQKKSLKAQMRYADKIGARYVVLIGEDEIEKGVCMIKDMSDGTQKDVEISKIVESLC